MLQPSLVSGLWSSDGRDMLTTRLDDMFSPSWTANDIAAIVCLNKHIPLPRPLNIVYHFADRAPLAKSQPSVFASCDTCLAFISSIDRGRFA